MFVLIWRQNLQRFAKKFLSLTDCLITPMHEGSELEGFDVETFLLLVLIDLDREEDELELIQAVVVPLRTMLVVAKEGLYSALRLTYLVQDRRNQYCWRKCISMKIVPVHGECIYYKSLIVQNWRDIKWKFVIETCRKQIQTGIVEHLEDWIHYRLIQCPLCFDYFVYSR